MQILKSITAPTSHILPTHELNGRRRRKQVIAPQTPSNPPQAKRNVEARDSNTAATAHLYSQFPPQGPLA